MDWFSGSLVEAISLVQTQKSIFVVFVEGSCDDKSKQLSSVLNNGEVTSILEKSSFICVKLEAASVGHRQLVETYKHVPIPSVFFISCHSHVMDIVEGNLYDSEEDLKRAVLDAAAKSKKNNVPQKSPPAVGGEALLEIRRKEVASIIDEKRKAAANMANKAAVGGTSASEMKKAQDEEEAENVKKEEAEKAKIRAAEKSMREEAEKLKREEANARKAVLEQIKQDREERAARMNLQSQSSPPAVSPSQPATSHSSGSEARIQFKTPAGESKSSTFPKDTNLSQLRKFVDSNFQLNFRDYSLATGYPYRLFTPEENDQTIEELNLVPTAVLLILPKTSGGVSRASESWLTLIIEMAQSFLQPLYSLGRQVRGWFSPAPSGGGGGGGSSAAPGQRPAQPPRRLVRKAGNIHSLGDLSDGNDENNTWNGNSTQQM